MSVYKRFSLVYDLFMEETPYNEWVSYIERIWEKEGQRPSLVAELACGTGNITIPLAKNGYEMTGIDISEEMLSLAKEKANEKEVDVLFLNQDMREFELYGTMDSIICVCDGLNYILEDEELLSVFKLVKNYLNPDGTFIFDLNTVYKFEKLLSSNSFCETNDTAAYIWENCYDEETMINEFYVNFFIKDENGKMYERFEEYHYERGYSIELVKHLLNRAGFNIISVYDAFTFDQARNDSDRIYFVVKSEIGR